MVGSIKKQGKNPDINNIKESFCKYQQSNNCTQWEIAFEQSQYLEQNKNKPRAQLINLNVEATSYNKRII